MVLASEAANVVDGSPNTWAPASPCV
jgi:hypothetical protein